MARLAQRVRDPQLLMLIGKMLKAKVVLPEGTKVATEEGVPQGGPLSPLLSNVVLSELDGELARRGHRFVRYADDCNIYVRGGRRFGGRSGPTPNTPSRSVMTPSRTYTSTTPSCRRTANTATTRVDG